MALGQGSLLVRLHWYTLRARALGTRFQTKSRAEVSTVKYAVEALDLVEAMDPAHNQLGYILEPGRALDG